MLDIKFIRENPELVKEGARKKNKTVDIDRLLVLDEERRTLRQKMDEKKAEQNRVSSEVMRAQGEEKEKILERMRQFKEGFVETEEAFKKADEEWTKIMLQVPNIPSPDTPEGKDDSENVVIRQWGEKPTFSFTPKPHWELGKELDLIDTEKAAEVSGSRFAYLKNELVMMQFGLTMLAFKTVTNEETLKKIAEEAGLTNVNTKPFVPVLPPDIIRADVMGRMARLDPENMFSFPEDNMVMIGSAEHSIGPIHMNEVLDEKDLPLRYIGFSTAFRREAGTYGKDTQGILRVHQFDKSEMETFVRPEDGYLEQDFLVAIQEYLVRQLKLPYQVMSVCTGDMGGPDHRQFDIETWIPSQEKYRETNTSDYIGGFQARRLNTRVKNEAGDITHVHMNDATAFSGRPLIAIMENYQQEDGSIRVPDVLIPYVGKEVITRKK